MARVRSVPRPGAWPNPCARIVRINKTAADTRTLPPWMCREIPVYNFTGTASTIVKMPNSASQIQTQADQFVRSCLLKLRFLAAPFRAPIADASRRECGGAQKPGQRPVSRRTRQDGQFQLRKLVNHDYRRN